MSTNNTYPKSRRAKRYGLLAISPMAVLIACFLTTGICFEDFYKMPLLLVFIFTAAYALLITRGHSVHERINHFSRGAGHRNLLFMVWIFVMAGAFASSAKAMGAIDATVNFTLSLLPESMLLPGIFVTACFVSMSIGTSVGTIVALTPVAAGLAAETSISTPLIVAATVGGALFGDNLSFISDTTIVATRTQGIKMSDKFRTNVRIALPGSPHYNDYLPDNRYPYAHSLRNARHHTGAIHPGAALPRRTRSGTDGQGRAHRAAHRESAHGSDRHQHGYIQCRGVVLRHGKRHRRNGRTHPDFNDSGRCIGTHPHQWRHHLPHPQTDTPHKHRQRG